MKNSFQNKKKYLFISISECQSIQKKYYRKQLLCSFQQSEH
jgi:hypothetical protein